MALCRFSVLPRCKTRVLQRCKSFAALHCCKSKIVATSHPSVKVSNNIRSDQTNDYGWSIAKRIPFLSILMLFVVIYKFSAC